MKTSLLIAAALPCCVSALVPLIDGGKQMPKLYDGWMNEQIAKQASTGVANALAAGYDRIEVNFPAVPNVDEVSADGHLASRAVAPVDHQSQLGVGSF